MDNITVQKICKKTVFVQSRKKSLFRVLYLPGILSFFLILPTSNTIVIDDLNSSNYYFYIGTFVGATAVSGSRYVVPIFTLIMFSVLFESFLIQFKS